MPQNESSDSGISDEIIRAVCQTVAGTPSRDAAFANRLEFIANLLADAGELPGEPLLIWREADQRVKHVLVGSELSIGRRIEESTLAFPEDKLLSSRHLRITGATGDCRLLDLKSRNGTFVNVPEKRIGAKTLRDGDVIYAGRHIFVFLDQRRTE